MTNRLSIIVPAFNEQNRILNCLNSLYISINSCNSDISIRVIVVDDGSTDNTYSVVQSSKYDVEIYRIDNCGLSGARNFGIDMCISECDYIAFVDSDDLVTQEYISQISSTIFFHENVDIIEFSILQKKVLNKSYDMLPVGMGDDKLHTIDVPYIKKLISQGNWFAWARVYKSSLFQSRRFSVGRYYEDSILIPLIYLDAKNVFSLSSACYKYILRNGSITSTPKVKYIEDLIYSYELFYDEFSDYDELLELRKVRLSKDIFEISTRMNFNDFIKAKKIAENYLSNRYSWFSFFKLFLINRIKFYIKSIYLLKI
jgi:glycosyltransferase involved in cell wall biosynthesis